MSYSKLNLKNGEKLNEIHLAHIEEGIAATEAELANKAAKTDIPDVSDFAKHDEVQELVNTVNPTTEKVHQMLTIDGNGEKVWEDKLCYTYEEECIVHEGFTVPAGQKVVAGFPSGKDIIAPIQRDEIYTVIWDNQEYTCTAKLGAQTGLVLGNLGIGNMGENTGEPFMFMGFDSVGMSKIIIAADTNEHVCGGVKGTNKNYACIDGHYIAGGVFHGQGRMSTSIGYGQALGELSVAINNATAESRGSFAEGAGHVHAGGICGHAEGSYTHVYGDCGHAEGTQTSSYGECQHVQGKYNVHDTEEKYAHIVGNGTVHEKSNAHTIDWNGNAWFSGDIYVSSTSGTNQDDGSKKVATEDYVNNNTILTPATAAIGQILMVKNVDANGRPIEWEMIDLESKVAEIIQRRS